MVFKLDPIIAQYTCSVLYYGVICVDAGCRRLADVQHTMLESSTITGVGMSPIYQVV